MLVWFWDMAKGLHWLQMETSRKNVNKEIQIHFLC